MKNKQLVLEHSSLMFYSRELIALKTPIEINVIFYSIISLFVLIITNLFFIRINDVKKVSGIIRSQENNSEVSNVISGTITSINYKPNQFVKKGEVLYTLDDKEYLSKRIILKKELENAERELLLCNTLLLYLEGKLPETKDSYITAKIKEYSKTVGLLKREQEIYHYQYEYQHNLPESIKNARSEKEAYLSYKLKKEELEKYVAGTKAAALENLKNLEIQIEEIKQQQNQIESKYEKLYVTSPLSGYVQEISSLNKGDYLESGKSVLKVIPLENKDFRVELSVPTKDIGELSEGMEVKYRLSAFPFFEYKGAEGKITSIDPDIRASSTSLYYTVYSNINKTSFSNYKGKEFPLRAGIEVDARIVLEKITIASYVFRKMGWLK